MLAGITAVLVRATLKVARQSEADVRAQWTPVLLVRDRIPEGVRAHQRGVFYNAGHLVMFVENVGRGPAFDVQAWLDDYEKPGPVYGVPEGAIATAGGMGGRLHMAVAPADLIPYEWSGVGVEDVVSGWFDYQDMSGFTYSTRFEVHHEVGRRGAWLHSQRVETGAAPIGLVWWQRMFPSWLVGPLSRRRLDRLFARGHPYAEEAVQDDSERLCGGG